MVGSKRGKNFQIMRCSEWMDFVCFRDGRLRLPNPEEAELSGHTLSHTPNTHDMKFSDSPCWTAPPKGAIKATGYLEPLSWPRLPRTISLSSTSAGRLPFIQAVLRSPASPLFANENFREENLFNAIPRVKAGRGFFHYRLSFS